jgi:hypothetical protein
MQKIVLSLFSSFLVNRRPVKSKNGHFHERGKTISKISLVRREKKEDKEEDKEEEEKTERGRNALKRKVIRKFFFRF